MTRRQSALPLEKRKNLILVKGDWQRLERICSPAGIKPTTFIRELLHKTLARIESRAQDLAQPVELAHDILTDANLTDLDRDDTPDADESLG